MKTTNIQEIQTMPGQTVKRIEVSDSTFERLQKLAKPLVDTSDSVVTFLIDYYEKDKFSSAIDVVRPRLAELTHPSRRLGVPQDVNDQELLNGRSVPSGI